MEKNSTTRHVAIVEKCVMTEMAWRYIFSREDNSQYRIHFLKISICSGRWKRRSHGQQ